jgi:hypothetical protein
MHMGLRFCSVNVLNLGALGDMGVAFFHERTRYMT